MNIDNEVFDGEELLVLARIDVRNEALAQALSKLKTALSLPEYPQEVLVESARLYSQLGLFTKAQPLYKQYLERIPGDIDAKFQLGMTLFETGRQREAVSIWDEVMSVSEYYPPALFYKSLALLQLRYPEPAKALLEALIAQVESDNLYVERARKLLEAINEGQGDLPPADARLQ